MSLLTLIQNTCDLMGLARPQTVINSVDTQVRQLFALAVEEADDLHASYPWQIMTRQRTFTTTATPEQLTAIADDFAWFLSNSFFNRTTRRPVLGPISPQLWQNIQANPQINRVILAFRERGGEFLVTPNPPADQTIGYEYISDKWAVSEDGLTEKTQWTLDTDDTFLSEKLIKLGLRWRFRKSKGLPYAEDFDTYQQQKEQMQARDGGSTVLNQTGGGDWVYVGNPNVPETGFGAA